MKKLILIDSHAIIHRAYHALPPLSSPAGEPTGAVYGFTTILLRILRELKPDYIAAAFDLPGPTFRHVAYERYKAQRPETPSDLSSQFGKVREVLDAFGIQHFEKEGYEADDIIGTIAAKLAAKKNLEVIVVTGDMDALQLVRSNLKVYSMRKGISDTVTYDEKAVKERYGFKPAQLIDFKGLKGDPSDNIPGVKGIGDKTATELIKEFGSVEGIYKALKKGTKKISPAVAEKLRTDAEAAKFSKELATIHQNVPLAFRLEEAIWRGTNPEKVNALFQKLGFASLIKRVSIEGKQSVPKQAALISLRGSASRPVLLKREDKLRGIIRTHSGADFGLLLDGPALFMTVRGEKVIYQIHRSVLSARSAKELFEQTPFFVYDGKAIIKFLQDFGVQSPVIKFDILLAAYVSGTFLRDFSYLAVAARELGRMVSSMAVEELPHFFEIIKSLEAKLAEGKLRFVFDSLELPLISVLADMEERGIKIDSGFLVKLSGKVAADLQRLTKKIYQDAGEEFNINSPQQLSKILFEKLGIKTRGLRKTEKEGRISTGAAELEKLKTGHPIVSKILEYRELAKLQTTYVDVLPKLVDRKTGRLHTTFNQTVTATGRLSSTNPNLQNIPVMSELGREVRKAFVAEKEFLLVSFDYSQIELRVAAHIADDKKMIEAFKKALDIHKLTAAEIYNVALEKVTPELRRAAKTLNFGVLFGMGSQAFAEATGMSREDAKKFIDEYFHDFSGIKKYIEDTKRFAEINGYVETIFGRRRYIPEIHSPNGQWKREAEGMAVNMPIQGSATGDIIKLAMIKVDDWIKKEDLCDEIRLLLQVHDELLFEIKKDAVKKYAVKIKEIMESAAKLKVPLVVDIKSGENWGEQNAKLDFSCESDII